MKFNSKLVFPLIILCTAGLYLLLIFGVGSNQTFSVGNVRQGLDLMGGVSILYEANIPNPSTADMNAANNMLRDRLDRRGYLEATAVVEGSRQIRVEIPGVDDAEAAVAEIGATALLTFRDEMGNILLTGADVADARSEFSQGHGMGVSLRFTSEGTQLFADATRANMHRPIMIYMDEELISAPNVNAVITDGVAQITGRFTREEADLLASQIRSGSLPFGLEVISMNYIGARLGAEALQTSIIAGIIGLALVLLFMGLVYRTMGLAANLALVIYVALVMVLISGIGVTLSLPGIAGIILSIGMAVDANVVIFERIREEISVGKSLRGAIRTGYKRAWPAILDSNVTTLIAGGVLFWLGTGPIMGFAQMLIIGILVSMFTCLFVTRIITTCLIDLGLVKSSHILPRKKNEDIVEADEAEEPQKQSLWALFKSESPVPRPIVEKRKIYFAFSVGVLAIGLAFMLFHGVRGNGFFNMDVEFSGGTSFFIEMGQSFENADVENIVRDVTGIAAPQVQPVIGEDAVMIRVTQLEAEARLALIDALAERYNLEPGAFSYADVSPAVSQAMQRSAILAIVFASLGMLLYISIRFRDLRTGGSAVIAQLHDALVVLCVYGILRIPLNYAFIAVMLTTLGYSINATIIIFDRMRENRERIKKGGPALLMNTSVTQTLRRTVISTLTSFLAVLMLYIIGVAAIRDFTLPILVGLVFGGYSSVFLSGSMWFMMVKGKGKS
ncbi:MAG: protein translocase subunit SecD [Defluviitaleaceae bacterium]|nr:protein translocase subunit SecD [Defluviitaleaceae bacterium]